MQSGTAQQVVALLQAAGALTPEAAVSSRKAVGGTAPGNVARETARWAQELGLASPSRRRRKKGRRG